MKVFTSPRKDYIVISLNSGNHKTVYETPDSVLTVMSPQKHFGWSIARNAPFVFASKLYSIFSRTHMQNKKQHELCAIWKPRGRYIS